MRGGEDLKDGGRKVGGNVLVLLYIRRTSRCAASLQAIRCPQEAIREEEGGGA